MGYSLECGINYSAFSQARLWLEHQGLFSWQHGGGGHSGGGGGSLSLDSRTSGDLSLDSKIIAGSLLDSGRQLSTTQPINDNSALPVATTPITKTMTARLCEVAASGAGAGHHRSLYTISYSNPKP